MNEQSLDRLSRLAPALKHSAHLLLHHRHNLSLDTQTLVEMQDAFSLILEMEQHTNFHVLPPNHRQHPAIPHLQMVYDLLQKVTGLRLWPRQGHQQGKGVVSLRCFRSLRSLEVTQIPVTRLRALQALRSQVRRLVVTRGLTCMADLFVRCGADQAGEYVWEQLVEATLSHNLMQGGHLDDSLRLLPNLKVLDISHCGLEDVSHLQHLPSLSYLDLSHNRLPHLPHLPPTSSPSLVVLLASHNEIHHLGGLQMMTGLEEVNLGHNFLASRSALVTLAALPRLRSLVLAGNPVCCDPGHRRSTLCVLHPGIVANQFLLDNQALTVLEQQVVGSVSAPPHLLHPLPNTPSNTPLLSPPTGPLQPPTAPRKDEQPPIVTQNRPSKGGIVPRRRSRKQRTRQITLGGEEGGEGDSQPPSLTSPTTPTPTPNAAARLKDESPAPPPPSLALDATLPMAPDTLTRALAALTHTPALRSDQEQNDRLLEEILQAGTPHPPTTSTLPTTTTTTPTTTTTTGVEEEEVVVVEEEEEERKEEEEEEEEEGFYKSAVERRDDLSSATSDEEEEEEGACLILAQRLEEEEEGGGDVILSVASTQFKEKHFVSTKTLYRWDLRCVETVIEQQHEGSRVTTVQMTFDTSRPTHRSRRYTMEREDFLRLQAAVTHNQLLTKSCDTCLNRLLPSEGSSGRCTRCVRSSRQPDSNPPGHPLTSTPLHYPYSTPRLEDGSGGGDGVDPPHPHHDPHTIAMQDSSSSGSMTGSVCTAYERGGVGGPSSLPPTPHKAPHPRPPSPLDPPQGPPSPRPPTPPLDSIDGASADNSTLYLSAQSTLEGVFSPPQHPLHDNTSSGGALKKEEEEEEGGGGGGGGGKLVSISPWIETLMHTLTGYHWHWWEDLEAERQSAAYSSAKQNHNTDPNKKNRRRRRKRGRKNYHELKEEATDDKGETGDTRRVGEEEEEEKTDNKQELDQKERRRMEEAEESHDNKRKMQINKGSQRKGGEKTHTNKSSSGSSSSSSSSGSGSSSGVLQRPDNPVCYNYEDLTRVDHRLQLYLEVVVLTEPEEHLLGLVKAVMLVSGGRREFLGLLVLSSHKYYLLEITGPQDDTPQGWLDEVLRGEVGGVEVVHSLYQRQGVALSLNTTTNTTNTTNTNTSSASGGVLLLVCLADSHRANCFFNFLMEVLGARGVSPTLVEASPTQEEVVVGMLGVMGGEEEAATPPSLLAIVSLLTEGGCSDSQYLVVNDTDLILYVADLTWYLPTTTTATTTTAATTTATAATTTAATGGGGSSGGLTITTAQKIANVTSIEVNTAHHLSLHFLDEVSQQVTSWRLHLASPLASWQVIEAVRQPWSDLFSLELQVTQHTPL